VKAPPPKARCGELVSSRRKRPTLFIKSDACLNVLSVIYLMLSSFLSFSLKDIDCVLSSLILSIRWLLIAKSL